MTQRILLLSAFLLCATSGHGQDWARFRGPDGQGNSAAKGLPTTWSQTENLAWKVELPGAGSSSPVCFGDKIFLTCYTGTANDLDKLKLHLLCLSRDKGMTLWQADLTPKLPEQGRIRENHGYASSTPVVDAERVYAHFGKSGVVAFDHNGKEQWRAEVGDGLSGFGSGASPILVGDLLIVNASVESESIIAFDKKTGKEKWRARGIKESWNTPVLVPVKGGKDELVLAMLGKVLALDPTTGEHLWSCKNDIGWYIVPSIVAHEGHVWSIGGRSGVAALCVKTGGRGDVTNTHRVWSGRHGSNVSSPLYHDGHLYWINDSTGTAYCAEAATGKLVYEQRMERGESFYAAPILADGKIYYVERTGRTFVLAASPKFERLAVNDLRDRSTFNASLAVVGKQLLLRSERYLYCIGK